MRHSEIECRDASASAHGIYRRRSQAWFGFQYCRQPSNRVCLRSAAWASAASIILAGQMSYDEDSPAGGIATVWLPTGSLGAGPHTALVLREAKLGAVGPTFRGVRIDQGGRWLWETRAVLQYGGEYVLVGLGTSGFFAAAAHAI